MLRSTADGPGKYGNGNNRKPTVIKSHTHNMTIAAVKIGHMFAIHRRVRAEKRRSKASKIATPMTSMNNKREECGSSGGSFFSIERRNLQPNAHAQRTAH